MPNEIYGTLAAGLKNIPADGSKQLYHRQTHADGAHEYFIACLDEIALIGSVTDTLHETILPGKECRLFLDWEAYIDLSPDGLVECADEICRHVAEAYSRHHFTDLPKPVRFTASRPGKASLHIVYDVCFKNAYQVLCLIKDIPPIQGAKIDEGLYSKTGAPKSLRMPFQYKLTNEGMQFPLVPLNGPETFDPVLFRAGLATYHDGMTRPNDPLEIQPGFSAQVRVIGSRPLSEADTDLNYVIAWLALEHPLLDPQQKRVDEDGGATFYTPFFCKAAKRWHRRNRSCVHISPAGVITARCLRPECRSRLITLPLTTSQILQSRKSLPDVFAQPAKKKARVEF